MITSLPRVELAKLPTPLEPVKRLGKVLGGLDLWFKRDDLTGFGLGGNKVRSLEYLAADAIREGADMLVTGGSAESNHVRTTMAVAAHLGLRGVAVLPGEQPAETQGNLLLNKLLKAKLVFSGDPDRKNIDKHIGHEVERLRALGGKPYMIRRGGVSPLGCVGYVLAAMEICSQLKELNIDLDLLLCATGCGVTQAGLLVGFRLMELDCKLYGVTVSRRRNECIAQIERLTKETTEMLGLDLTISSDDIIVFDDYIGEGYGKPTADCIECLRLVARTEGVFLDPIYTAKAMVGLTDLVKKGGIGIDKTALFLHTGGVPSVFSYASTINASNNSKVDRVASN
ncbi:MAG: D-cysteine desulfhydrase family protein [Candidatus Neomarinimicrobiota bacterium]|nr:D-cysteine desulfhydrase family protein [Candidatus Neomarinimicrobiota bacterium]